MEIGFLQNKANLWIRKNEANSREILRIGGIGADLPGGRVASW
jgi:hypothetical protein